MASYLAVLALTILFDLLSEPYHFCSIFTLNLRPNLSTSFSCQNAKPESVPPDPPQGSTGTGYNQQGTTGGLTGGQGTGYGQQGAGLTGGQGTGYDNQVPTV